MTPPPLPSKGPQPAPRPTSSPRPSGAPQRPHKAKPGANKIWLIVGLSLIGVALIACVILFVLNQAQKGEHVYDDGFHEKALQEITQDAEVTEIPAVETQITYINPRTVSGEGTAGGSPMTLDIDVDDQGNVTGTYWNVLYCLKFDVKGTQKAGGDLDLTLSLDNVTTPLRLTSSDMRNYHGTLGESQKSVSVTLGEGHRNYESPVGAETTLYGHLKGPAMNRDFRINLDYDGNGNFWFPDQGYENRLPVSVRTGHDVLYIYGYDGTKIATIVVNSDYETGEATGTLTDFNDRTFDITSLY